MTYIAILLLRRDRRRLTKVGTEAEGFANGGGMLVSVLLLDVGGSALELLANLATVDENLPVDDTSRLAVREDVLQADRKSVV